MSISHCVAKVAASTLLLLSATGAGSPGIAQELGRTAPSSTNAVLVQRVNTGTTLSVPDTAPKMQAAVDVQSTAKADTTADADVHPSFASLDEAVAAQSVPEAASDDLTCLAGAIYFESKGEPLSGQLAVAEVILNRTASHRFPSSVCSVVTQPGQFSFVHGGQVPHIESNANYRKALAVAQVALAASWDSPAPKALYFHGRRTALTSARTQVATIGNHVFYR